LSEDSSRRETNLKHPWELTAAAEPPEIPASGVSRGLRRLEVFLDVLYALLAFHMLSYLPPVRDMSWAGKPFGLLGALTSHGRELWRAVMGMGVTMICWHVSATRLARLRATDGIHTTITLVQAGLLCFFVYFAICDPTLTGGPSSRALQCGSVALAAAVGHLGWIYARWRGFIDVNAQQQQIEALETSARTEIATAILNTPLSWVGPTSWTLGWVILPLLVRGGLSVRWRKATKATPIISGLPARR
jgi:hypothetical protein